MIYSDPLTSPSPNQNKLNSLLTTVTVRIGWNLTCKQYDGFGVADLVPGSVFSNEKSPSLSNHSGSYQNHPPSCPALTELSWSDLRLSTGFPKTGTDFKLHRFLFVLNKWFGYIHYIGQPWRIICPLQNTASWFGVLPRSQPLLSFTDGTLMKSSSSSPFIQSRASKSTASASATLLKIKLPHKSQMIPIGGANVADNLLDRWFLRCDTHK